MQMVLFARPVQMQAQLPYTAPHNLQYVQRFMYQFAPPWPVARGRGCGGWTDDRNALPNPQDLKQTSDHPVTHGNNAVDAAAKQAALPTTTMAPMLLTEDDRPMPPVTIVELKILQQSAGPYEHSQA
ncbi:unnamed protein product [Merluccius merluccius]